MKHVKKGQTARYLLYVVPWQLFSVSFDMPENELDTHFITDILQCWAEKAREKISFSWVNTLLHSFHTL